MFVEADYPKSHTNEDNFMHGLKGVPIKYTYTMEKLMHKCIKYMFMNEHFMQVNLLGKRGLATLHDKCILCGNTDLSQ